MNKNEPQNLSQGEKAVQGIMRLIGEKHYEPGDRLPTETQLSELLGVSKNMVREALRVLVSRNIVIIRQGSGTFISDKQGVVDDPFGFSLVTDRTKLTKDILQIRTILEPQIAALAAVNGTEEEFAELMRILEELEKTMDARRDYNELDAKLHNQIAVCTHNMVMENIMPVIAEGINVFAVEVQETDYINTKRSHRRICEAILSRNAVAAQQEMMYHILYNNNRFEQEQI